MSAGIEKTLDIRGSAGRLCGTYHYEDPSKYPFKSFFRGLFTPSGQDVVAQPPPDHPHHKGLQFGLCASDINFWEEDKASEAPYRQLPIGTQTTTSLKLLPPTVGNGFSQEVLWADKDNVITFHETREISVTEVPKAYIWTWHTKLVAARNVEVIKSDWDGPGYCGLGVRLSRKLFEGSKIFPPQVGSGSNPPVSFEGKGVLVAFAQKAGPENVLFVSTYEQEPYFAFIALGPTNLNPRHLDKDQFLEATYVVTVADL